MAGFLVRAARLVRVDAVRGGGRKRFELTALAPDLEARIVDHRITAEAGPVFTALA